MPSVITSVVGGIQSASASHNAADAQAKGYSQASQSVNDAVSNANPIITNAANTAGAGVTGAANSAGEGVLNNAGWAVGRADDAARNANASLNPYIQNGANASDQLSKLTTAGFHFSPTDLQNDPGYQFTLQQGMKGLNNSMAARGLGNSGAALKGAGTFATGLAQTTYGNAFNRALSTYGANVNSLLPQASMGMGASGQAGANLINAAQYGGNMGMAGAQYAGNTGMAGAEYAGDAGMKAANNTAGNLINAGVYQGNTQIGSGNAMAQGDIGAANSWNSMLGGIGQAGNAALGMGFAPGGGGGWSFGNIGKNFGNLMSAGYGGGGVQSNIPGGSDYAASFGANPFATVGG